MTPEQHIEQAISIMADRNDQYSDGYKRIGHIMRSFFPDGLTLYKPADFARYQTFAFIVAKMNRYAQNITKGGHMDSSVDIINYAAILSSLSEDDHK